MLQQGLQTMQRVCCSCIPKYLVFIVTTVLVWISVAINVTKRGREDGNYFLECISKKKSVTFVYKYYIYISFFVNNSYSFLKDV